MVNEDLPSIARQGSGSACRSIYGGFVQWKAGVDHQGDDSTAVQIAADTHWPEMRIIILVVKWASYTYWLKDTLIYLLVCNVDLNS